jgi:predicted nucleic acid-binding protein
MNRILVDTGPLVAYLQDDEQHHAWTVERFSTLRPPFFTCEAVLAEACFLIARGGGNPDVLFELVERGLIRVSFQLDNETPRIRELMRKYKDLPMSLADACLIRMTEQTTDCLVVTLDGHFRFYRRHGRKVVPVLLPESVR